MHILLGSSRKCGYHNVRTTVWAHDIDRHNIITSLSLLIIEKLDAEKGLEPAVRVTASPFSESLIACTPTIVICVFPVHPVMLFLTAKNPEIVRAVVSLVPVLVMDELSQRTFFQSLT